MAIDRASGAEVEKPESFDALYLAVLPSYRRACIDLLKRNHPNDTRIWVSSGHLDPTVKTGLPVHQYNEVRMIRLGKMAFVQVGAWGEALRARSLIVDLNPRSLTAWTFLFIRRLAGKRTLVWGHLHPQRGAGARTALLRRMMRRLSSGTISYTYRDRSRAQQEVSGSPVWVAANSIYESSAIAPSVKSSIRDTALYVGRFEPAKKVALLVQAFKHLADTHPNLRLTLIGDGSEKDRLRQLVDDLGLGSVVQMPGWIDDANVLREQYARAFCSLSPGFAGLGLTQSLGFGVPMVVAKDEPHSPEIELSDLGAVYWAESDSAPSIAEEIEKAWNSRDELPLVSVSHYVRENYSAEAMARGLSEALAGVGESNG